MRSLLTDSKTPISLEEGLHMLNFVEQASHFIELVGQNEMDQV